VQEEGAKWVGRPAGNNGFDGGKCQGWYTFGELDGDSSRNSGHQMNCQQMGTERRLVFDDLREQMTKVSDEVSDSMSHHWHIQIFFTGVA